MGIYYSFNLAVGFICEMDSLTKPFIVVTEDKFHMEDRFDSKSGAKLEPVKVVDERSEMTYVFMGKTYENQYELREALEEELGCNIYDGGGYSDGKTAYISVDFETDDSGEDYGRVCVGGKATFEEVAKCKEKCIDLKKALNALGVGSLGEAMIYVSPNIS